MGTFNDGDSGSSIRTKLNTAIEKTEGTSAISTIDVDGGAIDGVTLGTNSAVTEAQVDNININGNTISSTDTNGDVTIDPNGAGDVNIGNFKFDADQTVGAGQDNYVLTYDNAGGKISLEAAAGGGGGADLYAANESSPTAQPSATGANAIAIGEAAVASGTDSFAIGSDTDSTGSLSTALGKGAQATANYSLAMGLNASATGERSVGIGNNGIAAGASYSTAIGHNSGLGGSITATGSGSMALGGSRASGVDSFAAAIANNTSSYGASGANSIAIGKEAKATGLGSVALYRASSEGLQSLAFGLSTRAAANFSIALGSSCIANADFAIALGKNASSDVKGKIAFSNFTIAPTYSTGSAQSGQYTLGCQTSDATATTMTSDNSATVSSNNQVKLHDHEAVAFEILLVGRQDGTDGSACAAWKITGLINRASGVANTTLVNSSTTVIDNTPSWGTPALSADTTNGCLKIQVTGAAATDIAWVATVTTSELTHS